MGRSRANTNKLFPDDDPRAFEAGLRQTHGTVAGVEEVGRGCLAGPVVAAAVILHDEHGIEGINDSKALSPASRHELDQQIRAMALAVAIGVGEVAEVDEINILQASLLAMRRAIEGLSSAPGIVLVDGRDIIPGLGLAQKSVIGGDSRCESIGAASIVAKVYRDQLMEDADRNWPGYGFAEHKGYGSKLHRQAIAGLGPCPLHRKTFRGVRDYLDGGAAKTPGLFPEGAR